MTTYLHNPIARRAYTKVLILKTSEHQAKKTTHTFCAGAIDVVTGCLGRLGPIVPAPVLAHPAPKNAIASRSSTAPATLHGPGTRWTILCGCASIRGGNPTETEQRIRVIRHLRERIHTDDLECDLL